MTPSAKKRGDFNHGLTQIGTDLLWSRKGTKGNWPQRAQRENQTAKGKKQNYLLPRLASRDAEASKLKCKKRFGWTGIRKKVCKET